MLETARDAQTDKDKTEGRISVHVQEVAAADNNIGRNGLIVRQSQSTLNSQSSLSISNSDERSATSGSTTTKQTISSDDSAHTPDAESSETGHSETNPKEAFTSRYCTEDIFTI